MCLCSIDERYVCIFPGPSDSYWTFPVHLSHGSDLAVFVEDPPYEYVLLCAGLPSAIFAILFFFYFFQEILVFFDRRSQSFSSSRHPVDDHSGPIRHRAKTHMLQCPIGGKGSSFSILVIYRINVGGARKEYLNLMAACSLLRSG